jgi:ornithine carbamoyltransferase
MYFEHPSLRTHVTFEAGMSQLGGHAVFLSPEQVGVGTRESPRDVALNLSRWVDAIVARTASHTLVEELAGAASIPVINGLTDLAHPCQAMADFLTIMERVPLARAVVAYVGDGNNVANSLLDGAAALGVELRLATPETHRPALRVRQAAERLAARSGARISWTAAPSEAIRGADFVYTDVWTSMGQEAESEKRRALFEPYQLNSRLLRHAPEAYVLHCLPAHRGEEITSDVLDGARSIVLDQAENRLHAQKAILERLILAPRA